MNVFLDTSVLIATFYGEHENHERSFNLFSKQQKATACTAAHCLTEFYSVVTRMPGRHRANPDEAMLFLQNARERLSLVTLDDAEYFNTLEDAALARVSGGTIDDAVIARCALKAKVQALYTWNVKHLVRLGENVAALVKQP